MVKQLAICLVKQFAICLVKQFAICLGVVAILLLTVMDIFSVGGGAIWLNPLATVLFTVCSAVTVECCVLHPCCVGVFDMFAGM